MTAAVTGGLAGIYYGIKSIPMEWMTAIARQHDIIALANRVETPIDLLSARSFSYDAAILD